MVVKYTLSASNRSCIAFVKVTCGEGDVDPGTGCFSDMQNAFLLIQNNGSPIILTGFQSLIEKPSV